MITAVIVGAGHRGDYYAFRIANNRARYGRKFTDKVIILKGRHDLRKRHPMRKIHYSWNRPADRRIQFGTGRLLLVLRSARI